MKNVISLTMGDWSYDGHNMTRAVVIESNLDVRGLEAAYKAGVKKTGVDLTDRIAREYEDDEFPDEAIEMLRPFGFQPDEFLGTSWKDETVRTVSQDNFWRVWLFIAKVGNPILEFMEVEPTKSNINIGGYGMFYT